MFVNMSTNNRLFYLCILSIFVITACTNDQVETTDSSKIKPPAVNTSGQHFTLIQPESSGVTFSNLIKEDYVYNVLNFEYLYNGGGVAIGDINNDGLPDLYFTGTIVPNKLYLNKGQFQFEDITQNAGVAAAEGFKTGVTMADVNSDGWLDIYVCRTSKDDDGKKDNLLYINNKDNTFTESAAQFGLKDNSNSNHGNFFDYDLDGDLDLYLLNHRLGFGKATQLRLEQQDDGTITRKTFPMTPFESDRLYRNDGGKFTDVSKAAGIDNSAFGLSATVGDINKDGYPDIFVANDYVEPDFVYINNRKGGFTDQYNSYIRHGCQNTMGSDLADFNNDGLIDIIALDMISEDPVRYKELMNIMQLKRYETLLQYGYGHQVSRNTLQLNNGNGSFSEVGQIAGISHTDWSWGAFFADFDNDGLKDVYITNGYKRDVTNLDYMAYTRDSIEKTGGVNKERYPDLDQFLDIIPSTRLSNYIFKNKNGLEFQNVVAEWGMDQVSFSNGTAYADLDADGDLDIVVNNISDPAFIYENKSGGNNYLQINFKGTDKNTLGIGTRVTAYMDDGTMQYAEMTTNRGFFSSSEPILHFGLGDHTTVSRLEVVWPDGKSQVIEAVDANQRLNIDYKNATKNALPVAALAPAIFKEAAASLGINYKHTENEFQDFNREQLLPHKFSRQGPSIAVGDVNGDGREDFFVGGASNSAGVLYLQAANGQFKENSAATWTADAKSEDIGAVFFDADNDKDLDLFVVSGGNELPVNDPAYKDRLYLNDGKGNFSKTQHNGLVTSGSCVSAYDFDQDGDQDIFVGGRVTPGSYPIIPQSYLLRNDNGKFVNVTSSVFPTFNQAGMITDIIWADIDKDGTAEMLITGEWMPLSVYKVNDGKLSAMSGTGLDGTSGWWNCVIAEDFDKDGDLDLVAGNLGANTRIKASADSPLSLYAKDFDQNGQIDPLLAFQYDGKTYPYAGRDNMIKQVAKVKKKFTRYAPYARATLETIFSEQELASAQKLEATQLMSSYFENNGNGQFSQRDLPAQAQLAPCQSMLADDFNGDQIPDLLLVGNNHGADVETGIYDASNGTLLIGDGKGNFEFVPNRENGFWANQEARDIAKVNLVNGKALYLVANNDGGVQGFVR